MNRWNIPQMIGDEAKRRDTSCVYCGVVFGRIDGCGNQPSWEHIINDARIITRENIVLCCRSCNSSKGSRLLADWIDSPYCKRRGINRETVAEIVKKALSEISNGDTTQNVIEGC